jgi:DNA primase
MGRIPEHVVDAVRARADLVEIVGRYVTLRRSGPRHWGLCPFHSEKTASFQVHEDRQIFYCFGCRAGGDVFEFRRRVDSLDFPDAVRTLARELRIPIPEADGGEAGRLSPLLTIHEAASHYFRAALRGAEGKAARAYLESRGMPSELIERFGIGFAPALWDGLLAYLRQHDHSIATAEQAGLLVPRQDGEGHYDRFRGRVMFPICEPSGGTIGFGGRALGDEPPKYMNSPESPIYRKGRVLFGLPQALDAIRKSGRAIVVEGYFDLLALHRAGLSEVVAPCGTALTEDHARRLRRYAREVILLFDGDEAGRRAAERALPTLLAEGLRVRGAFLPNDEDPDSLLARAGAPALLERIERAEPLLDALIEEQLRGASTHAWAAADAARALAPFLRALPDPIERQHYLHRVAGRLQVSHGALEQALEQGAPRRSDAPEPPAASAATVRTVTVDAVSRELLVALAAHPDLVPLVETPRLEWLPEGDGRRLVEALCASARARGPAALAHLCSAQSTELDGALKSALVELVTRAETPDRATAEQAVRDCMARLESGALRREYRDLAARIQTSEDPAERQDLLEAMQRKLEQRRVLGGVSP